MNARDKVKLLFGPYAAPALKRGDRASCLARDCDVVITSWTKARISWPRCRVIGRGGGGSGILLDEELARAVRNESAAAIRYWWGAARVSVQWWRRTLGVGREDPPGSKRLYEAARQQAYRKTRGKRLSPSEVERRRRDAIRLNLARFIAPERNPATWKARDLALLGTAPDEVIAAKVGRTANAVRVKRTKKGIPSAFDRRRKS